MKTAWRVLSVILVIALLIQLTTPIVYAETTHSKRLTIIEEKIDECLGTFKQVAVYHDSVYYSYVDKKISYCSQLTPSGIIQFSYVLAGANSISISRLYSMEEICDIYGIVLDEINYEDINKVVIDNLLDFSVESRLDIPLQPTTRYFYTLQSAIEALYGTNYSGHYIGYSLKQYNGTDYHVYCIESQSTTYTTPNNMWFAAGTALTALISWALTGNWSWIGAVESIIKNVVITTLLNGVTYTVNSFTASRCDVTCMRDRMVIVDGYSGTQYWAGWTRKTYFFKGENGWTYDYGSHYNLKHSDYDDVLLLNSRGFENFVNYTLLGGN